MHLRYVGGFRECQQNDCNAGLPSREVDAWYKLDLFAGYHLRSVAAGTTVSVGVDNALDRSPPVIYGATEANSDGATYDYLGRLFYVRLSQSF